MKIFQMLEIFESVVNVMIIILCDFCQKLVFFLKNNVIMKFFFLNSSNFNQKGQYFRHYF
jgi:hypothetical protein